MAEPLRLRSDVLVQTQAPAPVGLIVLQGQDRFRPWLDAETVTWVGVSRTPDATGDVLSLSVRLRDLASGSEVRFGRMLIATGAIRPIHLDGVRAIGRAFGGTTAEVFGGFPVASRFDYRAFDVAAGGRLGQSFGDVVNVGGSYLQRRSAGNMADEEVGADASFVPNHWLAAAARWSFDLTSPGTSEALASVSAQKDDVRGELFATYRSPGRILPSTSLFSVLGDIPSTLTGATARYRMFPRLEVLASGSAEFQGSVFGGQGFGRATLALDDAFDGTIGVEARRVDFGTAQWTGARILGSKPVARVFRVGTEFELVVPDHPRGRGTVWPWVLGSVGYRPAPNWDLALAFEASSGPQYKSEANVLLRASYAFQTVAR
ncbi:hypothetical protein AKJ09_07126 [Labilithrix luteola]|uniref:Uncharacterized protein n=1 Tax=Labilithrix luteola TaxID=1391654 RepID=A0A0K1Q3Y5_9BACT|nr:hypothetical protein [Labilithrix luteola]AKV00463.1 hypothetical protein AKJ09_07126 [Labilithrix luteola]